MRTSAARFSLAAGALLALSGGSALASTITFLGSDLNVGSAWRDSSVPKAFGVGNVYGTAGYDVIASGSSQNFGNSAGADIVADPTFVAAGSQHTLGENRASGFNYASEDDPTTPHPPTPGAQIEAGTVTDGTGDKFQFTIGSSNVPANFEIAIMVDNLDAVNYNASALDIRSVTNGNIASAPEATGDQNPDLYVFDISNAAPGEVFDIGATQGINGTAPFAAVAFDVTSVPEPATSTVAGALVLFAVGHFRRRPRA